MGSAIQELAWQYTGTLVLEAVISQVYPYDEASFSNEWHHTMIRYTFIEFSLAVMLISLSCASLLVITFRRFDEPVGINFLLVPQIVVIQVQIVEDFILVSHFFPVVASESKPTAPMQNSIFVAGSSSWMVRRARAGY